MACAAAPPPRAAPAPPPSDPPRGYVPATRSVEECGAARARTASLPPGSLNGLQQPVPRIINMPPFTRGRKAEGRLVAILRVDVTSRPMRDSIFVSGAAEPSYLREYEEALSKNVYWPAVLDGCNVTARVSTEVILGPRP